MITSVLGVLGPILAALVAWVLARRQNNATADHTEAQAAQVIQETALGLIEPLRAQVAAANSEVDQLRAKVRDLSDDLDRAHDALTKHGIPIP